MAVYFLRSKHLSRGKGAKATRAAAYRAGEKIYDQRTGATYNHSNRQDVAYKEVVLPEDLAGRQDMAWTQDRAVLWNAAEHAGRACNSRVAREFLVILPSELTAEQRNRLARGFAQELASKYTAAVDLCIHLPRPDADERNHHAHLLMTVREVGPDGMGPRTTLELNTKQRLARGLPLSTSKAEYLWVCERWATLTNAALRQAGLSARVDHRSFAKQGLNREPGPNLPEKVIYAERRLGRSTPAGDAIRARHQQRVEARLKGPGELARVLARQREERIAGLANKPARSPRRELTPDERNARAREYYRRSQERIRRDPVALERQREASRRASRARRQKNPEAIREWNRRWHVANKDKRNRKQREYHRQNAAEFNARRREQRRIRSEALKAVSRGAEPLTAAVTPTPPQPAPTPLAPAKAVPITAEDSVRNWQAWSQEHGKDPTPEESVRNWLAYMERPAPDTGKSAGVEDADPKPRRDRGPDYSL